MDNRRSGKFPASRFFATVDKIVEKNVKIWKKVEK